jgi:hypothetical protein
VVATGVLAAAHRLLATAAAPHLEIDVAAGEGLAAVEADDVLGGATAPDVLKQDVADRHGRLLLLARPGVGRVLLAAVVLVDGDGVLHLVHHHVQELDVPGVPAASLPRLDPSAVQRPRHVRRVDGDVRHLRLRVLVAEAPDANPVPRAALHLVGVQVFDAGRNGDAIVSGLDDPDILGISFADQPGRSPSSPAMGCCGCA